MRAQRQGMSSVGLIVGIAIVIAGLFAVAYWLSDPFRTRANVAYDNFAHWTPENIARDPVNYLNFCEQQTKNALLKLKAGEVATMQKKAQIEAMLAENQNKQRLGSTALGELKASYRKAEADGQWPVSWQSAALDREQCKRQILKLAGEISSKSELIAKLEAAVAQLKAQTGKVQEARDKANEQLTQIATSREVLKVQQITDELKSSLVSMKTVIQTSVIGVAAAEPGSIGLDDLAAAKETSVNEAEFARIMKE